MLKNKLLAFAIAWFGIVASGRAVAEDETAVSPRVEVFRKALRCTPEDVIASNPSLKERVQNAKPDERASLLSKLYADFLSEQVNALRSLPEQREALRSRHWPYD